jgi:AcrR family transcriptional regulator
MGNRADLLAGAKRCLYEKGYAHTTARDIAAASGTSLASIGYHFRSTSALLGEALFQVIEEWGEEVDRALAVDTDPEAAPMERFEAIWGRLIESFTTRRQLWAIQIEMVTLVGIQPELGERLGATLRHVRSRLTELFGQVAPAMDESQAKLVGAFYNVLLYGIMVQWLVDPDRAPSAHDLAEALTAIAADNRPIPA